jgi:uncharacterized protein YuzE
MRMLYFPDTDTLSIQFPLDRAVGQDTMDPDVTLFFDDANRISEILVENASRRLDLNGLRREPQFEEIVSDVQS